MVFAVETYCPATDGISAARIEEEVILTPKGAQIISLFPADRAAHRQPVLDARCSTPPARSSASSCASASPRSAGPSRTSATFAASSSSGAGGSASRLTRISSRSASSCRDPRPARWASRWGCRVADSPAASPPGWGSPCPRQSRSRSSPWVPAPSPAPPDRGRSTGSRWSPSPSSPRRCGGWRAPSVPIASGPASRCWPPSSCSSPRRRRARSAPSCWVACSASGGAATHRERPLVGCRWRCRAGSPRPVSPRSSCCWSGSRSRYDSGRGHAVEVFEAFYRAGALVFGGGHVVLPLLEAAVVPPGWVSERARFSPATAPPRRCRVRSSPSPRIWAR